MDTPPEQITKAVTAAGAKISRARPVCDGSTCWIVEFSSKDTIPKGNLPCAEVITNIGTSDSGEYLYRAHFTQLTPGT